MVLSIASVCSLVEFIGSRRSQSSVLRADALHLLMDVVALGLSLFALRLSAKPAKGSYTFGFRRAEPLAALANAVLILAVVFEIVHEGVEALLGGNTPESGNMLAFATFALFANGFSAWLLHGAMHDHGSHAGHSHAGHSHAGHSHAGHSHAGHSHAGHDEHAHGGHGVHLEHDGKHELREPMDGAVEATQGSRTAGESAEEAERRRGRELNLRGALLHLMGDALGAVAALVAAIVIRAGGPRAIDPIASFFVAAILFVGALRLARDAIRVLSEAAPRHLAPEKIRAVLETHPGVATVAAVRAWTLGGGDDAIVAHVVPRAGDPTLAKTLAELIKSRFTVAFAAIHVDPPAPSPHRILDS
jgi:cation diffusion facilitator family transporter